VLTANRLRSPRFVATILLLASLGATGNSQGARVRTIPFTGNPLVGRIIPGDDEVVVVTRDWGGGWVDVIGEPDAEAYVYDAVHGGALAAVLLRVESVAPRMNEAESWIHTEVIGRIEDVLFTTSGEPPRGSFVALDHKWGGEARLYGVLIRAGFPLPVRRGLSYLVFLARTDEIGPWRSARTFFAVENGRLVAAEQSTKEPRPREPLAGMRLAEVSALIREAAKTKRSSEAAEQR
jgi:hypothetical protein